MATKDSSIYLPQRYKHYVNHVGWTTYAKAPLKLTRTRTGTAVANWKDKIEKCQNATSDMSGVYWYLEDETPISSMQTVDAFAQGIKTVGTNGRLLSYLTPLPTWSVFTSNADNQAKARFLKKVRETEVAFQGLIFLGELRETLRMLKRPAAGLQDLIKEYLTKAHRLKKGSGRSKTRRFDQAVSKLWLEYAFGWVPLMSDIRSAKDAYNKLIDRKQVVRISSGGKDFKRFENQLATVVQNFPNVGSWYVMLCRDFTDQTDVIRYRGVVRQSAITTSQGRYKFFGFTPSEFVPTAWELLPWSFLFDYFANIGEILEASVTSTASVAWVNKSRVQYMDRYRIGTFQPISNYFAWPQISFESKSGSVRYRGKIVSRYANSGISPPSLSFRLPHSDSKLLNIAALLDAVALSTHPQRRP